MISDRDLGRVLDRFYADGPSEAPDRVLDVLGERIADAHQRPGWSVRSWWSMPQGRHGTVRVMALVAALIAAALAGAAILSGGRPDPLPVPTPPPTPSPPTSLISPTGVLAPGDYLIRSNAGPATFTLPAGWSVASIGLLDFSLAQDPAMPGDSIRVFYDMHIASKDEACTEAPEPGISTTADAIIDDLVDNDLIVTSDPVPISIGGLSGAWVDVRIAPRTTKTCPSMGGGPTVPLIVDDVAYVADHPGPEITFGPFWGVAQDERLRLIVLDRPDGGNVTFVINSSDGTNFDSLVAASMPVIESFVFDTGR